MAGGLFDIFMERKKLKRCLSFYHQKTFKRPYVKKKKNEKLKMSTSN